MKEGVENTLKFKKLKRRLGLAEWQVIGLLESIWKLARTSAQAGDIGRHSDEDIAAAIEYEDDAEILIQSLVECGWLDADDEFRLIVHDWSDHVPTYLKGNFAKHNKQFADEVAKQRAKQPETPPSGAAKQGAKQGANSNVLPNQTKPNQTKPNQKKAFVAPSLQEVQAYCAERSNQVDPSAFLDHYTANGWMRGRTKIKDWKACVRTWEKRDRASVAGETGLPDFDAIVRSLLQMNLSQPYSEALTKAFGEKAAKAVKTIGAKRITQATDFELNQLRKQFQREVA